MLQRDMVQTLPCDLTISKLKLLKVASMEYLLWTPHLCSPTWRVPSLSPRGWWQDCPFVEKRTETRRVVSEGHIAVGGNVRIYTLKFVSRTSVLNPSPVLTTCELSEEMNLQPVHFGKHYTDTNDMAKKIDVKQLKFFDKDKYNIWKSLWREIWFCTVSPQDELILLIILNFYLIGFWFQSRAQKLKEFPKRQNH